MAITVSQLKASFTSDTADLEQGVARAARASDKAAADIRAAGSRSEGAFDGLSAKAVALGGVLSSAITGGIGLMANAFSSAISAGASFGETLNRIQAVGGASADQLALINEKALELGAKLPISAQQGADGMLALVAGGMSVEQALTAVDGVAGFAAAQMLDVGSAAEIVSSSLTSFGLGAEKASYAADIMSQVANSSAADVRDWGESIKYVGPVAGALKQPIEDMGVAIGLMANQSIKGSSAGTALRTMLTNLAAPSKEVSTALASMGVQTTNAAGQMMPFISIAEQMRGKMAAMTDVQKAQIAETIAGKEGMSGFLAIVNAAPGDFDKMKQSMASAQGATEEFAKATNKGFAFEWGQLQGSIETVLIQGFQAVEPVLSSLTGVATGFVNAIGGGMAQVGPAIAGLGAIINPIIGYFTNAEMSALELETTLAGLVGGGAANALTDIAAAAYDFGSAVSALASGDISSFTQSIASGVANVARSFGLADETATDFAIGLQAVLGSAFQLVGSIAQTVLGGLPSLFQAIQGPAQSIASSVGGVLSSAFSAVGSIAQTVFNALPGYIGIVMSVVTALGSYISSYLAGAFQVVGPIAQSVFSGIATIVQTAMPGVMSLASAVGSLLVAAFGALQAIATSVFAAIQPYIPAVQAAIGNLAAAIGGTLNTAFQAAAGFVTGTVVPALTNLGQWLADNLPGAIQTLANFWTGTLQPAIAGVAGWVTGTLFPLLGELFNWAQAQIPGALQVLSNFWQGTLLPAIQTVAGWVTGTLFPLLGEMFNWLQTTIPQGLAALAAFWQTHGDTIMSVAQTAWDTIQAVIDAVLGTITGLWQAFQSAREDDWRGFGEKLRDIWNASWEAIKGAIANAVPVIVNTIAGLVNSAKEKFTSVDWASIGKNIIDGVAKGISNAASSLANAAMEAAQNALEAVRGLLDIGSPSQLMADEVGLPMAQGIAQGFLDALQGGALAQIIGGVRGVLADLAGVLDGIGGVFSNSDLEKFRDGIGALGEALASIAGISGLFSKGTGPSLAGLVGMIRQLALDARSLLSELDVIVPVISETLAARLDALGKAAAGARSVADNAFGLIRTLAETLAFDFGAVNWSTAYHNLIGLAQAALIYVQALDPVALVVSEELIARLQALGTGAAAVKAVAENTFGLILVLVETLKFDFAAPDWSTAWHNLMGLIQAAIDYSNAALALANTFTGTVTPAAEELGKAVQLAATIVKGAFDLITTIEDIEVPTTPFLFLLVKLGQVIPLASRVSDALLQIASSFVGIVTPAAEQLGRALPISLGIIKDSLSVITTLAEADISAWVTIPLLSFMVKIGQLVPLASNIAAMVMELASRFAGQVTPAAEELGRALSGSLGIVKDAFDLITFFNETLADGPIDMTTADIHAELADALTTYVIGVAEAFLLAAADFAGEVTDAARALVDASGMAVGVVTDAYAALVAFSEMLVNGPLDMTTADIHAELADALTTYIAGLTIAFLMAAQSFAGEVTDAARALRDGAGMAVGVVTDAYDALLAFNEILVSGPVDMTTADIHAELVDALTTYISGVTDAFLLVANEFTGEVTDAARALRDGAGMAMGVVADALDALAIFSGALVDGPVDMTSADIHAELVDALTTYAVGIATAFLTVANDFEGIVSDAARALGDAMGEAAGVVKEVLDFSELHQAILDFRGFDMAVIGPKLALIFGAAVAIAQEFGRRAETSGIKEAWVEAGAALSSLFGDAASTLKDALDLGAALLDPETQIPSIGQIQGKVDALFNIIQGIAAQFAARATAAASAGMNFDQIKTYAETVKGVFEAIREVAAAVADFTGVSLGASGFNNIAQVLNAVFTLFEQVAGRASVVNQVSAAIASVLGGLATLVDAQAYQAGVDIGTRIADGIAAGLTSAVGVIGASIITAANTTASGGNQGGVSVAAAGGGGGGSVTYIYNTDNSKNITVSQVINTTSDNVGKASGGLYGLLASY